MGQMGYKYRESKDETLHFYEPGDPLVNVMMWDPDDIEDEKAFEAEPDRQKDNRFLVNNSVRVGKLVRKISYRIRRYRIPVLSANKNTAQWWDGKMDLGP